MGFSGTFLVASSDQPLPELGGVRDLSGVATWHGTGENGWQLIQLHHTPAGWRPPMTGADGQEHLLESLLAQTGRPVLAGVVLHSDGAQVIGYSPRAGRWSGWLMLERLIDYLGSPYTDHLEADEDEDLPEDLDEYWSSRYRQACRPLHELAPPVGIAAPHAVTWANEAGYTPNVEHVEAVLNGGANFAEDHFLTLLTALGLPAFTPHDASRN